jgi:acyl transferase domain-containing protein
VSTATDLQREVPLERWDTDPNFDPSPVVRGMNVYMRFGAFCSGVDSFDASLFKVAANEAALMDPQQRMLMEQMAMAWADASGGIHAPLGGTATGRNPIYDRSISDPKKFF